jgi:hypothetical protein
MANSNLTTRFVNFSALEYDIVCENAQNQFLFGSKESFSGSVRQIIQQWRKMKLLMETQPPEVRILFSAIRDSTDLEILPEDVALESSGRKIEFPAELLI